MARLQCRIFDITTHCGIIVTGSTNTFVNTNPLECRLFDIHVCPLHGPNCVVTGSLNTITNVRLNTRLFDVCACGALLATGSPNTTTN